MDEENESGGSQKYDWKHSLESIRQLAQYAP